MSIQRERELGLLAAARTTAKTICDFAVRLDGYEFTDQGLAWVWDRFQKFADHNESPTLKSIEAQVVAEPDNVHEMLRDLIKEVWDAEPTTTPQSDIDTLRTYHLQDSLIKGMDRATKAVIRGELDGAQDILGRIAAAPPPAEDQRPSWPTLDKAALHGLAGDIVRTISPHTEADETALLAQFLAAFGNVIGRSAHYKIESTKHFANLFVVLVGETAKARKGTSWDRVMEVVGGLDDKWNRAGGLSTGEGLIELVRDELIKKGKNKDGEEFEKVIDEGVADKRLLVAEPEFTRTLRAQSRDGNILSQVLREAWDHGMLRTATRASPLKATDAHISIIGHAVRDELVATMSANEIAGGTANRFLYVLVRRSKKLAHGGNLADREVSELQERTRRAVAAAKELQRVVFDSRAREMWESVYDTLSEGRPGMVGRVTARAEAQVSRLSAVYAALDGTPHITEAHLRAALAVWRYADASAAWIFGSHTGNPIAEKIRDAMRASPDGVSLSEVWQLVSRHGTRPQIDNAIRQLEATGELRREMRATGGRPATMLVSGAQPSSSSFAPSERGPRIETPPPSNANEEEEPEDAGSIEALPSIARRKAMLARMAADRTRVNNELGAPAAHPHEAA